MKSKRWFKAMTELVYYFDPSREVAKLFDFRVSFPETKSDRFWIQVMKIYKIYNLLNIKIHREALKHTEKQTHSQ